MTRAWMSLGLGVMLALAGCDGGGGAGADAGRDGGGGGADGGREGGGNPSELVGNWIYEDCSGLEGTSCFFQLELAANGSYTNRAYYVKSSDSTTGFPGCTINIEVSGYRWTATATTLSLALGDNPTSLVTYTDCDDPSDNQLTPSPTPDFVAESYTTASPQTYSISGDQLTIGGPGGLVLMRTE